MSAASLLTRSAKNGPERMRPNKNMSNCMTAVTACSLSGQRAAAGDAGLCGCSRGADRGGGVDVAAGGGDGLGLQLSRGAAGEGAFGHPHQDVFDEAADQGGVIADLRDAEAGAGDDAFQAGRPSEQYVV